MIVRDLIDSNQHITDVTITIRQEGRLVDELNIGLDAGVKPPYPTRVPKEARYIGNACDCFRKDATYLHKSINAWDDGKDYWQVKTDRIPKKWQELEVDAWHVWSASRIRHPRASRQYGGDYEHLYITALPSGERMEIKELPKDEWSELPGQMNILDFIGGDENEN